MEQLKDESPRMIEIGAKCNNNCVFCCQYEMRKERDKTTQEIKQEIDLAKKDGRKKISFLGGEFTIRQDSLEIIAYAKSLGFGYIHITTNGRMFSYDDYAKAIVKAGLTVANFSIYAPTEDVHDSLTRAKGSFQQAINGLQNFLTHERRVAASITIVKGNYKYLVETITMLQGIGVHLFHINGPIPEGLAKLHFRKTIPKYSHFVPYLTKAVDHCKKYNLFVSITNIPPCQLPNYTDRIDEVYNEPISVMTDQGTVITEDQKRKMMKTKLSCCNECSYDLACEGVFIEYVKHVGEEEFVPVR